LNSSSNLFLGDRSDSIQEIRSTGKTWASVRRLKSRKSGTIFKGGPLLEEGAKKKAGRSDRAPRSLRLGRCARPGRGAPPESTRTPAHKSKESLTGRNLKNARSKEGNQCRRGGGTEKRLKERKTKCTGPLNQQGLQTDRGKGKKENIHA